MVKQQDILRPCVATPENVGSDGCVVSSPFHEPIKKPQYFALYRWICTPRFTMSMGGGAGAHEAHGGGGVGRTRFTGGRGAATFAHGGGRGLGGFGTTEAHGDGGLVLTRREGAGKRA